MINLNSMSNSTAFGAPECFHAKLDEGVFNLAAVEIPLDLPKLPTGK